ncbi:biotin-dependent carboxyltransferase [Alteromonadaceae bacterium M269]|nr:biotin-dependent carboxyltransferase [Alteromonadaceae bacterium M269]
MSMVVKQVYGLALIQDQGRYGCYDYGITTGGAMDRDSHDMANLLVDNSETAATLELSMATIVFEASKPMLLCLCGAESDLTVNGQSVPMWQSFAVKAGDSIEIKAPTKGCRAYLAVNGGIDTNLFLNSRSTVVREGIGGFEGISIKFGDVLPVASEVTEAELSSRAHKSCDEQYMPHFQTEVDLRVVWGYQHQQFSDVQKQLFFSSAYEVTNQSDRMGYRLSGQPVICDSYKLASEGICLGAIQIPADGQPIILMRDRQTIGGYPKIGAILSIDLNQLSQLTAGGIVRFTPITVEDSHNALHKHQFWLKKRIESIKAIHTER